MNSDQKIKTSQKVLWEILEKMSTFKFAKLNISDTELTHPGFEPWTEYPLKQELYPNGQCAG